MKKTLCLTLALVMILSLFAGCGKTETPAAQAPAAEAPAAEAPAAEAPAAEAPAGEVLKLRTCTQNTDKTIATIVTRHFAELVAEKSNGTIQIEVYINAELGSEQSVMEQVMTGTLELAPISTSVLSNVVPECGIYTLPFMFPTLDVYGKVATDEGFQQRVYGAVQEQTGCTVLGGLQAIGRGVSSTKKPIYTADDLKGQKIRTIGSSVINDAFEAMGATVTSVSWKEVYTALQQGLVDGEDSTVNSNLQMKFIEYTKYFTELNEMYQDLLIIVNGDVWNKLTPEQQQIMQEAGKEAYAFGLASSQQYVLDGFAQAAEQYPDYLIIKREDLSEEQYNSFRTAAQTVWGEYTDTIGTELVEYTKNLVDSLS